MRTLKKALSLVLCVVMVMGLLAFNVSAKSINDYNDSKDIKYTEAAVVLSALGVINGKDNGNYDPKGELTRAEAAVIICRLLDVNPAGKSTFTDIRDPFYDPYIGYLQNQGYVNGYGDGRFGPDDKLTGSAFAKMLLVALGYNADYESMTGPQWEIGVAKLLKSTNINGGIAPFNQSEVVTREVAAQMSLNALKADMVEYPNGGVNVKTTDGTEVTVNAGKASASENADWRYTNISDATGATGNWKVNLGEYIYETLKLDETEPDEFGRPCNKWTLNGNTIAEAVKTPVATIYQGTTKDNITAALSGYKIGVLANGNVNNNPKAASAGDAILKTDDIVCFSTDYNGNTNIVAAAFNPMNSKGFALARDGKKTNPVQLLSALEDPQGVRTAAGANDTVASRLANMLAKDQEGKRVEIFANRYGYITNIVVTEFTVGEVTSVTTASNGDVIYTINGRTMRDYADPATKDTIVLAGTLAKGDIVTLVRADNSNDKPTYVYQTEKFSGTQTSKDNTKSLTIDGNKLTVARGDWSGVSSGWLKDLFNDTMFDNSTKARTFYKDQYGYVVHAEDGEADLNYAVVDKISFSGKDGLNGSSIKAVLAFTDGKTQTVTVYSINGEELKGDGSGQNVRYPNPGTTDAVGIYNTKVNSGLPYTFGTDTGNTKLFFIMNKNADDANENNNAFQKRLVSYTVRSDGKYELQYGSDDPLVNNLSNKGKTAKYVHTVNSPAINNYGVTVKNNAVIKTASGELNTNDNTIYMVRSKGTTYDVYTGYRSVPVVKTNNTGTQFNISYVRNGRIQIAFLDAATGSAKIESSSDDIFYATTKDIITENVNGKKLYKLDGILNGEATTLVSEKNFSSASSDMEDIEKGWVYRVETDGNKYVTKMVSLLTHRATPANYAYSIANGTLTILGGNVAGGIYYPANDTVELEYYLEGVGIADSDSVKDIASGSFKGFSWVKDQVKVVVIDDYKIQEGGSIESLAANDAYYIQTMSKSGDNRKTIKLIIIDKGVGGTLDALQPDATAVEKDLDSKGRLEVSNKLTMDGTSGNSILFVEAGQTLILNGGLAMTNANTAIYVEEGGTLQINGNATGVGTIDLEGKLIIKPTDANAEISVHIDVADTGDVEILNESRNVIIAGNSLHIADGHGLINAKTVTVKNGGIQVYSSSKDTTALTINAELVSVESGAKLTANNTNTRNTAATIRINGNLDLYSATTSNVYGRTADTTFTHVIEYTGTLVSASATADAAFANQKVRKASSN